MTKRILFIEDNLIKAEAVSGYLQSLSKNYRISIKDSFRGGLKEIIRENYDLLLLDMSLPTWKRGDAPNQEGFERFGGLTIMREMKRKNKKIPTVVITMFNEFGVGQSFIDLTELDKHLESEFEDFYLGYVKYSSSENKWEDDLFNLIK